MQSPGVILEKAKSPVAPVAQESAETFCAAADFLSIVIRAAPMIMIEVPPALSTRSICSANSTPLICLVPFSGHAETAQLHGQVAFAAHCSISVSEISFFVSIFFGNNHFRSSCIFTRRFIATPHFWRNQNPNEGAVTIRTRNFAARSPFISQSSPVMMACSPSGDQVVTGAQISLSPGFLSARSTSRRGPDRGFLDNRCHSAFWAD